MQWQIYDRTGQVLALQADDEYYTTYREVSVTNEQHLAQARTLLPVPEQPREVAEVHGFLHVLTASGNMYRMSQGSLQLGK
jgi:hypothetical protein